MVLSVYLLLGLILVRSILLRWIRVNRRKIANVQAKQRLAAGRERWQGLVARLARRAAGAVRSGNDQHSNAASGRIHFGVGGRDRAFGAFGSTCCRRWGSSTAWKSGRISASTEMLRSEAPTNVRAITPADGRRRSRRSRWPTWAWRCIVLATTMIAAKNIPGLLEMAVLQHLPFDAGVRYAVATVSRYVIYRRRRAALLRHVGRGLVEGAMARGRHELGIGLRLAGNLRQFRLRPDYSRSSGRSASATWLRSTTSPAWCRGSACGPPPSPTGDRKELIIPNKEFITGRVLNWTLTDPVNRVVINVGIAYGSDTATGGRNPLESRPEPPQRARRPAAAGDVGSFGDSALNFVLRCFLPNLESRAHGDPRVAHGHRPGVPRGGHRNRLPPARYPRPLDRTAQLRDRPAGRQPASAWPPDAEGGVERAVRSVVTFPRSGVGTQFRDAPVAAEARKARLIFH